MNHCGGQGPGIQGAMASLDRAELAFINTVTESDVDNWHLELRTNNVCLDEYTVRVRMKNLSYLEERNNERTQTCEKREEACFATESAAERLLEERKEACSVTGRLCKEREEACTVQ